MIDKWLHKGQISQEEYNAVMKKLDGHDAEIKGQIIRDVLETVKEQNEIYLAKREKQIRADAIKECIKHIKLYKYNDGTYVVYDEILDEIAEQLKENNNEQ